MSRITEIRKNVTESTPVLAAVGATDVVVERVRAAAADAQKVQAGIEDALTTYQVELRKGLQAAQVELGKTIQAYQVGLEPARIQAKVTEAVQQLPTQVQQVPALAVSRALEVAGQVETGYAGLAERGKQLVERVRQQKPTQDLIAQSRFTGNLAKAAVTTARKAVDDTTTAARNAVVIGRREAGQTRRGRRGAGRAERRGDREGRPEADGRHPRRHQADGDHRPHPRERDQDRRQGDGDQRPPDRRQGRRGRRGRRREDRRLTARQRSTHDGPHPNSGAGRRRPRAVLTDHRRGLRTLDACSPKASTRSRTSSCSS